MRWGHWCPTVFVLEGMPHFVLYRLSAYVTECAGILHLGDGPRLKPHLFGRVLFLSLKA